MRAASCYFAIFDSSAGDRALGQPTVPSVVKEKPGQVDDGLSCPLASGPRPDRWRGVRANRARGRRPHAYLQMEPRAGTRLSSLITEPATGSSVLAGRLVSRTYHPGLELPVVIIRESNTADESEA